jgi:hypothetical protein
MAREQIRSFLLVLGYDPIMSEYSDVLYDPQLHTHTSCLYDIPNVDMVILLIGSRFGGRIIPEALTSVNIDNFLNVSSDAKIIEEINNLSITQIEVLKAIQHSIPVFAFIDENVWHDHLVYEKNKDLIGITFPSIENQESAKFIFDFINFLRKRTTGNSVTSFSKIEDIVVHLKKQWAALFQRVLKEQRDREIEERRINIISRQISDLKTTVLSTIGDTHTRYIAQCVLKYGELVAFLDVLTLWKIELVANKMCSFEELLSELGIVSIVQLSEHGGCFGRQGKIALVKSDGKFFEWRSNTEISMITLSSGWESFINIPDKSKSIIIDILLDMRTYITYVVEYHGDTLFDNYFKEYPKKEFSINEFMVDINSVYNIEDGATFGL